MLPATPPARPRTSASTAIAGHIQPLGRPVGAPGAGRDGSAGSESVPGGGYDEGGVHVGRGPSVAPIGWVSSESPAAAYSSFTPSLFPVRRNGTPRGRDQGVGRPRRCGRFSPTGAGVEIEVVGSRR